jgi:hypothetical protein
MEVNIMCYKFRDVLVFLAGAEFFHTLAHIMMPYFVNFPMDMDVVVMTSTMNNYAIVINAAITVFLLWWAGRVRKCECKCVCDEKMMAEAKKAPMKPSKKVSKK